MPARTGVGARCCWWRQERSRRRSGLGHSSWGFADATQCPHTLHLAHPHTHTTCSQNEADAYRNIKLRIEDVQGRNCLTNFYVSQRTRGRGGGVVVV